MPRSTDCRSEVAIAFSATSANLREITHFSIAMKKQLIATSLLVLTTLALPLKASAASFSKLFILGDSLSDVGNAYTFTGNNIPPSPPYAPGRFTNGPVWVEYLAQKLGLQPLPFVSTLGGVVPTQGVNYAFGGATTGTENTIELTFPGLPLPLFALQEQVGIHLNQLAQTGTTADPDALYIVWAGANDYIPTDGAFVPFTDPEEPLNNLANAIAALAQAGAKNFLVPNLPDLGQLPASQAETNSSVYTQVSLAHNAGLTNGLKALNPNIRVTELDVFSVFNQVLANPAAFGFTNTENPCFILSQSSFCSFDPTVQNQYVFWDERHPTTAVHKILGDLAYDALQQDTTEVPEPTVVFSLFAVGAIGAASLRRRKSA